jgi:uridine phosphorylase
LRGPLRSTHVPPTAADRPSITIAIEKMIEIGVRLVPKCSTSGSLNTLNA